MMDATDAWPAVHAARAWVLDQVELDAHAIVVDAGCGPGTFGASVAGHAIDIDSSYVMLREARRRRADARVVLGDIERLPVRDGSATLVRAERVRASTRPTSESSPMLPAAARSAPSSPW